MKIVWIDHNHSVKQIVFYPIGWKPTTALIIEHENNHDCPDDET
jgi:hypothetical protein